MTKGRLCIFWIILFAIVGSSAEAISFFALYVTETVRPGSVIDIFLDRHFSAIDSADVRTFENGLYDSRLGWDYKPLSHHQDVNRAGQPYTMSWGSDGAREDGMAGREPLIATYGDSFTAGEEVNNDETWQYFLSRQIGKRVVNFGTSGYGTDQALMKFKEHVHRLMTAPITILAIFEKDIDRIINVFRPFLRPEDGLTLGFKPRYTCSPTGDLIVEPNPLTKFREDTKYLRKLAAGLIDVDPYARAKIRLTFPYTLRMLRVTYVFLRRRLGDESWLVPGSLDLWAKLDTARLMQCIVDGFIDVCRRSHSKPVLLFIPRNEETKNGGEAPAYDQFLRQLEIRHRDAVIVDMAAQEFDSERFRITPTGGHTSPYGNRIIANALRQALKL